MDNTSVNVTARPSPNESGWEVELPWYGEIGEEGIRLKRTAFSHSNSTFKFSSQIHDLAFVSYFQPTFFNIINTLCLF